MMEYGPTYAQLYEKYRPSVNKYLTKRVGPFVAEDLTQETFLKGFKAFAKYQDRGAPIQAWFMRIARNLYLDASSHKTISLDTAIADNVFLKDSPLLTDHNPAHDPTIMAEKNTLAKKVRESVEKLPPSYQQIIRMRFYEDLDYQQMSQITGRTTGALRTATAKAVSRLRNILVNEDL